VAACVVAGLVPLAAASTTAERPAVSAGHDAAVAYGRLPVSFEQNVGQAPGAVRFVAHHGGASVALGAAGAVFTLAHPKHAATTATDVLAVSVEGADPGAAITGATRLPGVANYLIGNDPAA
jgi:hypothetical protein